MLQLARSFRYLGLCACFFSVMLAKSIVLDLFYVLLCHGWRNNNNG